MNVSDTACARLRILVAAIDHELVRLPATATAEGSGLQAAWAELVLVLALGTAPELRTCPACGRSGMRAATVCAYCWTKLSQPLPPNGA